MKADLHIHTRYSDGTYTPKQVVAQAKLGGVDIISVTDHDLVAAYDEMIPLCRAENIGLIAGVEVDTLFDGVHTHVLGYGFDLTHEGIKALCMRSRSSLEGMSEELIERMSADYPQLSRRDYDAFCEDSAVEGWKGIQYLHARGVVQKIEDGMRFYPMYGVDYESAGFPMIAECTKMIHASGGRAVLAHPGDTFAGCPTGTILTRAVEQGIDGVECYYPSHKTAFVQTCVEYCNAHDLLITCGGDSHGTFAQEVRGVRYGIGVMDVPLAALRLGDIRRLC